MTETIECPKCKGTGRLDAGLSRTQLTNIGVGRSDPSLKSLARIEKSLECAMKDLVP